MVISHKFRYVFNHTMKTASTALVLELRRHQGGEEILALLEALSEDY